jgi:HAMP domain-containing protein
MPKSLEEQLADIEDAERRLRPLVVEARQLYKDMRTERRETERAIAAWKEIALSAVREATQEHVKEMIKPVINEEIKQMVGEIGKLQHRLYGQVEETFGKVSRLFLGLEDNETRSLEELARHYAAGRAARKIEREPLFGEDRQ